MSTNEPVYTLITGASEGFGKALALESARQGRHLILVALEGPQLYALGSFLEREFSIRVVCIGADLSSPEACVALCSRITGSGFRVNLLINNAGMGGTHFFGERDAGYYQRQIQLNVLAPTLLTRMLLPELARNAPAHVMNVGSMAGFFNIPVKQVYGATKSYLCSFSKSLRTELRGSGVNISTVCPGGMLTNFYQYQLFSRLRGISRWSVVTPEKAARIALRQLAHNREVIIPGTWNRLFLWAARLLPSCIRCWIAGKTLEKAGNGLPAASERYPSRTVATWQTAGA